VPVSAFMVWIMEEGSPNLFFHGWHYLVTASKGPSCNTDQGVQGACESISILN